MKRETVMTVDEAKLAVGVAMPDAVDGILQRRWLCSECELSRSLRQLPHPYEGEVATARLMKVGEPSMRDWSKLNRAMSRSLMTCHRPGVLKVGYRLDVQPNGSVSIRFAVRSAQDVGGVDSVTSLANLTDILSAELPGTEFLTEDSSDGVKRRFYAPVTGIPGDEKFIGDFVTQLVAGMAGRSFSFMVEAEAMSSDEISQALYSCREMLSQIELLKSISVTKGENWTEQIGTQVARSLSESESDSKSSSSKGVVPTAVTVAGAIAATVLSGGNAAIGGLVMMGGGAIAPQNTTSETHSVTKGFSESFTRSLSVGGSASTTVNVVNAHAEAASEKLRRFSNRMEEARLYGAWKTSVCVMTDTPRDLDRVKMLVKALQTGDNSINEPVRTPMIPVADCGKKVFQISEKLAGWSIPEWQIVREGASGEQRAFHPMGEAFSGLATPITTRELVNWFGMPRTDLNGVSIVPWAEGFSMNVQNAANGLRLGSVGGTGGQGFPFLLNPDIIARHALVAGVTRSGKSNTCRRLLNEVRKSKGKDFPFMVIEPAKTEYLEWALRINEKAPGTVNVFMPGRTSYRSVKHLPQLKINPFELIWLAGQERPDVAAHIQHLTPIINAVLPMQESLPLLMEEAIYDCYAEPTYFNRPGSPREGICQWIPVAGVSKFPNRSTLYPTFKTLGEYAEKVVERKKYHNEANMGFTAAMRTRVNSFCYAGLPRGMTFNSDGKPHPEVFEDLFTKPTVINLSAVTSDDEKAFFMAVLFMFLYEYRCAEFEIGRVRDNSLRHLLVLEEAHCILRNTSLKGAENINAVGKVSEMFSNIISEIGAYGQGIMIVDQSPERIAVDAVKNTNLKIIHRLQYGGDIQQMSVAMNLLPAQEQILSTLGCGEAVLRSDEDVKPFRLLIDHE